MRKQAVANISSLALVLLVAVMLNVPERGSENGQRFAGQLVGGEPQVEPIDHRRNIVRDGQQRGVVGLDVLMPLRVTALHEIDVARRAGFVVQLELRRQFAGGGNGGIGWHVSGPEKIEHRWRAQRALAEHSCRCPKDRRSRTRRCRRPPPRCAPTATKRTMGSRILPKSVSAAVGMARASSSVRMAVHTALRSPRTPEPLFPNTVATRCT